MLSLEFSSRERRPDSIEDRGKAKFPASAKLHKWLGERRGSSRPTAAVENYEAPLHSLAGLLHILLCTSGERKQAGWCCSVSMLKKDEETRPAGLSCVAPFLDQPQD